MKITNKTNNWRSTIKHHLGYAPLVALTLLVQGCDTTLLDENADTDTLTPEAAVEIPDRPSPSEFASVMTTGNQDIFDTNNNPVLLRGVNLAYGDDPETRLASIAAIKATGANVVRLLLRADTTAEQLAAALDDIVANNMIAMPVLSEFKNEIEGEIICDEEITYIDQYTQELWFDEWIDVLVQDKYQAHLMINIANGWGANDIFDAAASPLMYSTYIQVYKDIIREFREIGFKVPLVIDAPHCGQDYNAFLAERGLELQAADSESNIILSIQAVGPRYNTSNKIVAAADLLANEDIPFIIGAFGGSGDAGLTIDHVDLMEKGIGDYALIFDMPWSGETDKAAYVYTLGEATDFVGAKVSADVYTPLTYTKDGNLAVQMYLKDSTGKYASLGLNIADGTELRANAWTTISTSMQTTDDLAYFDEGFDLADVSKIGIEVLANGKATEISGDIKFDNVKVEVGGAEPAMYHATFDDSTEGWVVGWSGGDVYAEDGSIVLDKAWSADANQMIATINGASINLDTSSTFTLTTRIFVPAEYADSSELYFKYFFQHSDSESTWYWDESSQKSFSDFTFGEWNDIVFENVDLTHADKMETVGFMFGGINSAKTDHVLIDSIAALAEGQSTDASGSGPMFFPTFDIDKENWQSFWGTGEISASAGSLAITPDWETTENNNFGFGTTNGLGSLDTSSPVTITANVFIPASYAGESDFTFQFFAQDEGWATWLATDNLSLADFTPGEWTIITFDAIDFTAGIPIFERFGIQVGGVSSAKADPILIDYVAVLGEGQSIEGATVELDLLFDLNFATQAEADAWVFDYADGSFDESTLEEAKLYDYGVVPFGWLANSWIGSAEGEEYLDMSTSENMVELTTRGEEIVNGENGIKATSVEASFDD